MAKQSSVNLDITNNADGFDISGGTTARKLGITGGDVTIAGSGSATVTFPTTSTTIAGLGISQTFTALQSFSAGISAAGGITFASRIQGVGATFTGIVEIDTGLILPNSQNITSAVTTFNGASGAVSFAVPLASASVTGVASFGNEFVVTSGAVGLTSNYVKSVNGLTGAVVSIATTGSNTFTGLNTFNAGISASALTVAGGATFSSANIFMALNSFNAGISAGGTTAATFNGTVNCNSSTVYNPTLQYYNEPYATPSITGNVLTLDLRTAQVFGVTLNSPISTFTISNTPATANRSIGFTLILTADGTARGITWGSPVKWSGGVTPTTTITNGKKDIFTFMTINGGTEWLGFIAGQNF